MNIEYDFASELNRQPFVALTPLYHFSSDAKELSLGKNFKLVRYSEQMPLKLDNEDICFKSLQIYPPDYMLLQLGQTPKVNLIKLLAQTELPVAHFQSEFLIPALHLFRQLRLFTPGRLFAGETFILSNPNLTSELTWGTLINQRASQMRIDFTILMHENGVFNLNESDVPFFEAFRGILSRPLEKITEPECQFPQLSMALELFGSNDGVDKEVLDLICVLETLLVKRTENLAAKLATRVSRLLEVDDQLRKNVFKDIKHFYDLRSRIIHGDQHTLNQHQKKSQERVAELRNYVRRVLLCIIALYASGMKANELERTLEDMTSNDSALHRIQNITAKFVHIDVKTVERVN